MTTDEIRIAIAESQGYWDILLYSNGTLRGLYKDEEESKLIPNYPEDLNAMHEAEKTLDVTESLKYREELRNMFSYSVHTPTEAICATALQRAEAYLRVKGLWKDEHRHKTKDGG